MESLYGRTLEATCQTVLAFRGPLGKIGLSSGAPSACSVLESATKEKLPHHTARAQKVKYLYGTDEVS